MHAAWKTTSAEPGSYATKWAGLELRFPAKLVFRIRIRLHTSASEASSNMSKKADQVRAAGEIAQILPETYSFLQQNFNDTRVDRAAAIKGIVHHLSKAHPNRNVMVCHPPHIANLEDAAKMRLELKTGLWGTTGVDIYVFTQGTFTNLGDGGDINWCFHGNFVRDPGHPNTVTFSRIY